VVEEALPQAGSPVDTAAALRYDHPMAVKHTPRTQPRKGGLLGNLLGLVGDLAVSAGQNVKQAASAASAGQVTHAPCNACTAPPAGGGS